MVNGLVGKKVNLRRGVRQGDPLSPYIFIIAMDFMPRWLRKLMHIGALRMPIRDMQPALFYADDALFFIKPEEQQLQMLQAILNAFASISGLRVNLEKSEILSTATQHMSNAELAQIMTCKEGRFPLQYLGLPLSDSALTKQDFIPLIQKINRRLPGWAAKLLTIAGRLTLVNAVLTSIPIYLMSVCKLPVWVIEEIDKTRRNFFWKGGAQNERKIHLANWPMLCKPKKMGGMGILDLRIFNKAILSKWYWQWQAKEEKMWKSLFLSIYCTQGTHGVHQSYFFRIQLKYVIGFCDCFIQRIVGQGNTIQLWDHDWGMGILKHNLSVLYSYTLQEDATLKQFYQSSDQSWYRPVMSEQATEQLELLQRMKEQYNTGNQGGNLSNTQPDDATWRMSANGEFRVQSAYLTMKNGPHIGSEVRRIWGVKAPHRFKIFAWLLIHNKILTTDNLKKRGYNLPGMCFMCRSADETVNHLFNKCHQSILVYEGVLRNGKEYRQGQNNITLMQKGTTKKDRGLIIITSFIVWRERCCRIFRERCKPV